MNLHDDLAAGQCVVVRVGSRKAKLPAGKAAILSASKVSPIPTFNVAEMTEGTPSRPEVRMGPSLSSDCPVTRSASETG